MRKQVASTFEHTFDYEIFDKLDLKKYPLVPRDIIWAILCVKESNIILLRRLSRMRYRWP